MLNRFPKDLLDRLRNDGEVLAGTVGEMKVENLRLDQLSDKQSLDVYDRFVFSEHLYAKLMRKQTLGVGDKAVIDPYQIVAIGPHDLTPVYCAVKIILEQAVFPEGDKLKRKSYKEEEDSEHDADDCGGYAYFPSVLHLILNLRDLY